VLTDGYRLSPYVTGEISGSVIDKASKVPLRYVIGTGFNSEKMWSTESLPDGARAMNSDWVLHFDCNPDLILEKSIEVQNVYLATRKHLELPELRWAKDLRFMAEQQAQVIGNTEGAPLRPGVKEELHKVISSHI
jgi:hypothetical protein